MNNVISIFSDASTSAQKNLGVGAYVTLNQEVLLQLANRNFEQLETALLPLTTYTQYTTRKSTWTEIQTIIDALSTLENTHPMTDTVLLYTDCKNICDLFGVRKSKLLARDFQNKNAQLLAHADLYKKLYEVAARFKIDAIKIKGHQSKSKMMSLEERIFSIIDKLSRRQLRNA